MANPVSLQALTLPTTISAIESKASQPTAKQTVANTDGSAPIATPAQTPAKTSPNAAADTVKISSLGQQALAESRETSTQTAKEAAHGDRQAIKLLAKQAAARAASLG